MLPSLGNEHKVGKDGWETAIFHYESFYSTEFFTLCTCYFDEILNREKIIVILDDRIPFPSTQLREHHTGAVCDFIIPSHAKIILNLFVGNAGFSNLEKQMILRDEGYTHTFPWQVQSWDILLSALRWEKPPTAAFAPGDRTALWVSGQVRMESSHEISSRHRPAACSFPTVYWSLLICFLLDSLGFRLVEKGLAWCSEIRLETVHFIWLRFH